MSAGAVSSVTFTRGRSFRGCLGTGFFLIIAFTIGAIFGSNLQLNNNIDRSNQRSVEITLGQPTIIASPRSGEPVVLAPTEQPTQSANSNVAIVIEKQSPSAPPGAPTSTGIDAKVTPTVASAPTSSPPDVREEDKPGSSLPPILARQNISMLCLSYIGGGPEKEKTLSKNIATWGAKCDWVLIAYNAKGAGPWRAFAASLTDVRVTIFDARELYTKRPIDHEYTFLSKWAMLSKFVLPFLDKYERVWGMDSDMSMSIKDFDEFKRIIYSGQYPSGPHPPLIAQPVVHQNVNEQGAKSKQFVAFLEDTFWDQGGRRLGCSMNSDRFYSIKHNDSWYPGDTFPRVTMKSWDHCEHPSSAMPCWMNSGFANLCTHLQCDAARGGVISRKLAIATESPSVEQQMYNVDAKFFKYLFTDVLDTHINMYDTDWGVDFMWCHAAFNYMKLKGLTGPVCSLVPGATAIHENSRTIVSKFDINFRKKGLEVQSWYLKKFPEFEKHKICGLQRLQLLGVVSRQGSLSAEPLLRAMGARAMYMKSCLKNIHTSRLPFGPSEGLPKDLNMTNKSSRLIYHVLLCPERKAGYIDIFQNTKNTVIDMFKLFCSKTVSWVMWTRENFYEIFSNHSNAEWTSTEKEKWKQHHNTFNKWVHDPKMRKGDDGIQGFRMFTVTREPRERLMSGIYSVAARSVEPTRQIPDSIKAIAFQATVFQKVPCTPSSGASKILNRQEVLTCILDGSKGGLNSKGSNVNSYLQPQINFLTGPQNGRNDIWPELYYVGRAANLKDELPVLYADLFRIPMSRVRARLEEAGHSSMQERNGSRRRRLGADGTSLASKGLSDSSLLHNFQIDDSIFNSHLSTQVAKIFFEDFICLGYTKEYKKYLGPRAKVLI